MKSAHRSRDPVQMFASNLHFWKQHCHLVFLVYVKGGWRAIWLSAPVIGNSYYNVQKNEQHTWAEAQHFLHFRSAKTHISMQIQSWHDTLWISKDPKRLQADMGDSGQHVRMRSWAESSLGGHVILKDMLCPPSRHIPSKWRRINIHATWSRRIDIDTTSF